MIPFLVTVLANALWQPLLMASIAWIVLRLSRCSNATTRHAVWTVALLASIVVPFVSAAPLLLPEQKPDYGVMTRLPSVATPTHVEKSASSTPRVVLGPQMERPHLHVRPTIAQIVAAAWSVIAFAILARLVFSFLYLERMKHDALPLSVERRHELTRWDRAEKGPRDVRICVSPEITVPVAVGIFDAMILLPQDLVDELDPHDLDRILLHELAHVRRSDDWVNLVERIALALFFFSPGMYWIARQMDLEREVACDDWVLAQEAENVPYARCLTKIVEMTHWPHRPVAAPGVFVTRKSMSIRIERLLARGRDVRIRLALVPSAIALVSIAAIVVAGGFVSPTIAYTMDTVVAAHTAPVVRTAQKPLQKPMHTAAPVPTPPANATIVAVATATPSRPTPRPTSVPTPHRTSPTAEPAQTHSGGYLDELAAAGYTNMDPNDVIAMKSVGVTGDYIRQMREAGLGDMTARTLVELKSMNVTPEYVAGIRNAGLGSVTARDLSGLKSLNITPAYITDMRNAGLDGETARGWEELRSLDVTPPYLQDLANAGYQHLTSREYSELKSLGVTGEYIRNLQKHGFSNMSVQKLIEFKSMGIQPK